MAPQLTCYRAHARVGRPFFLLVQGRDFTHKQKVLCTFDNTRKTPRMISYDVFNDKKKYQYLLISEEHTEKLAFLIF